MAAFTPATVPMAYRMGDVLCIPRGAALPANCVKCGVPAQKPWRKKFFWHHPALYLMILFPGLLIYAIVAMVVRKQIELNVPLCDTHQTERKQKLTIGAVLMAAAIPLGIVIGTVWSNDAAGPIGFLVGFVTFIVGAVFFSLAGSYMRPTKIDDYEGQFKGVSAAFMQFRPQGGVQQAPPGFIQN